MIILDDIGCQLLFKSYIVYFIYMLTLLSLQDDTLKSILFSILPIFQAQLYPNQKDPTSAQHYDPPNPQSTKV